MSTPINRYVNPTFPQLQGPDDTQAQVAASYNGTLGETAGERTDFLRMHTAEINRILITGVATSVTPPALSPGERVRQITLINGTNHTVIVNSPGSPKDGDELQFFFTGGQLFTFDSLYDPLPGNAAFYDGSIRFRWNAGAGKWYQLGAGIHGTHAVKAVETVWADTDLPVDSALDNVYDGGGYAILGQVPTRNFPGGLIEVQTQIEHRRLIKGAGLVNPVQYQLCLYSPANVKVAQSLPWDMHKSEGDHSVSAGFPGFLQMRYILPPGTSPTTSNYLVKLYVDTGGDHSLKDHRYAHISTQIKHTIGA